MLFTVFYVPTSNVLVVINVFEESLLPEGGTLREFMNAGVFYSIFIFSRAEKRNILTGWTPQLMVFISFIEVVPNGWNHFTFQLKLYSIVMLYNWVSWQITFKRSFCI